MLTPCTKAIGNEQRQGITPYQGFLKVF